MIAVLFANLLFAHLISDFWLPANCMVPEKRTVGRKVAALLAHTLIVASASFLLSFDCRFWSFAIVILITHALIDYGKMSFSTGVWPFVIEQILHTTILYAVSKCFIDLHPDWTQMNWIPEDHWLAVPAVACAVVVCTSPANILVYETLEKYKIDMGNTQKNCLENASSLRNAGALIGSLERLLILLFVLIGKYEAAGLTVAAKSILRFRDDEGPRTEFVLVGTLLSFLIAVVVAVALLAMVFGFKNL